MNYRIDVASGNKLSVLGMGCMRFPRDKGETERMLLAAIEGGVNFFDTAYIYPGSEKTLGEILAKNKKREKVFIATKLPLIMCKTNPDFDRLFNEQLKRLQTDYIDYYFLHNVTDFGQWARMKELGIVEWLENKKEAGAIRNIGFSYHGTCDEFEKILADYAWGFTMVQYNYYDPNYQAGGRGVEAAAEKGISVIIMEPLLGGRLATGLSKDAEAIFKKAEPNKSPADWALHWLWNQPAVTVVLSGMNSTDILQKNLNAEKTFIPLSENEQSIYNDVRAKFREKDKINCTGCNYCLPCPKGINIPAVLSAYNAGYVQNYFTGMTLYITSTALIRKEHLSPRLCNHCGKCEKNCPQNIDIRKALKKAASRMEPLPVRGIMKLARWFLS